MQLTKKALLDKNKGMRKGIFRFVEGIFIHKGYYVVNARQNWLKSGQLYKICRKSYGNIVRESKMMSWQFCIFKNLIKGSVCGLLTLYLGQASGKYNPRHLARQNGEPAVKISSKTDSISYLAHLLQKNKCKAQDLRNSVDVINNININIRDRDVLMDSIIANCQPKTKISVLLTVITEPQTEWFIKNKIIQWINKEYTDCVEEIVDYLLLTVLNNNNEELDIRTAMIWTLSDTVSNNTKVLSQNEPGERTDGYVSCEKRIIYSLSQFVQADYRDLDDGQLNFQNYAIRVLFASIVRVGIRNQSPLAREELKNIALNHAVNDYFRSIAVEALQGFAVYSELGAIGLSQVIQRVNRRFIRKSRDTMRDDEIIRNEKDERVRSYALDALIQLSSRDNFNSYSAFMLNNPEDISIYEMYWRRAFQNLSPAADNTYIFSALNKLKTDPSLDKYYKEKITASINQE